MRFSPICCIGVFNATLTRVGSIPAIASEDYSEAPNQAWCGKVDFLCLFLYLGRYSGHWRKPECLKMKIHTHTHTCFYFMSIPLLTMDYTSLFQPRMFAAITPTATSYYCRYYRRY